MVELRLENTANYNHKGISISGSNNNIISGNNANTNSRYGIYLSYSNYNNISGNNAD